MLPAKGSITGMSPGAEIISLKVLDKNGMGSWSSLVLALDHVEKFGVSGDVVLMSLGAPVGLNCANFEPFLNGIISDLGSKGITVVMSAGNDRSSANENLPGCINGSNVFTVGALDFTWEVTKKLGNRLELKILKIIVLRDIYFFIN